MPLQITAQDSVPGVTLSYSASGLPGGLTINSSTGVISGTPTSPGTFHPVITVTDSLGVSGTVSFTWFITTGGGNTVTVTNPGSQSGQTGQSPSLQITATDSATGQTLTFSATGLPGGLTISSSGLISGTLTTAGTFTVVVKAIDTTGAFGTATFTWTVTSPPSIVARVGCSVPNSAFKSTAYDAFFGPLGASQNQNGADSVFTAIVGRPVGSTHLKATKKFWNPGNYTSNQATSPADWHFTNNYNNMANYASLGTRVICCVQPAFFHLSTQLDPGNSNLPLDYTNCTLLTSAQRTLAQQDLQSLVAFMNQLKALGFTSKTARIVLWQEPANASKGISAMDYGNIIRTYGPAINASSAADNLPFNLVVNVNYVGGGAVTNATDYANAALGLRTFAPTGVTIFGLAMDFYTNSYYKINKSPFSVSINKLLDTQDANGDSISGIADAQGIPFGLHEFGCVPSIFDPSGAPYTNCTNYLNYLKTFMSARVAAGKPNLDCIYYDGEGNPTGAGDLTSPIGQDPSTGTLVSSTPVNTYNDFRIALFQNIFDAVNGN